METPADTTNRRPNRWREWTYRTYMAVIIGIAAAWPWSAVVAPALWPRFFYLLTGFVLMLVFVFYASRLGTKLRSANDLAAPADEPTRDDVPPRGIEPALDLASLAYDENGKITLPRIAHVVLLGSFMAALSLLLPS